MKSYLGINVVLSTIFIIKSTALPASPFPAVGSYNPQQWTSQQSHLGTYPQVPQDWTKTKQQSAYNSGSHNPNLALYQQSGDFRQKLTNTFKSESKQSSESLLTSSQAQELQNGNGNVNKDDIKTIAIPIPSSQGMTTIQLPLKGKDFKVFNVNRSTADRTDYSSLTTDVQESISKAKDDVENIIPLLDALSQHKVGNGDAQLTPNASSSKRNNNAFDVSNQQSYGNLGAAYAKGGYNLNNNPNSYKYEAPASNTRAQANSNASAASQGDKSANWYPSYHPPASGNQDTIPFVYSPPKATFDFAKISQNQDTSSKGSQLNNGYKYSVFKGNAILTSQIPSDPSASSIPIVEGTNTKTSSTTTSSVSSQSGSNGGQQNNNVNNYQQYYGDKSGTISSTQAHGTSSVYKSYDGYQFGSQAPQAFSNSKAKSSTSTASGAQSYPDQNNINNLPQSYGNNDGKAKSQPVYSPNQVKPQAVQSGPSYDYNNYLPIYNEKQFGSLKQQAVSNSKATSSVSSSTGNKNLSQYYGNQAGTALTQGNSYSQSQGSSSDLQGQGTLSVPKSTSEPQNAGQSYGFNNLPTYNQNQFGTQISQPISNQATSSASSASSSSGSHRGSNGALPDYTKDWPHYYGNFAGSKTPQSVSNSKTTSSASSDSIALESQSGFAPDFLRDLPKSYGINKESQTSQAVSNSQATSSASSTSGSQKGINGAVPDYTKDWPQYYGNIGGTKASQSVSNSKASITSSGSILFDSQRGLSPDYLKDLPQSYGNKGATKQAVSNSQATSSAASTSRSQKGINGAIPDYTIGWPQYYGNIGPSKTPQSLINSEVTSTATSSSIAETQSNLGQDDFKYISQYSGRKTAPQGTDQMEAVNNFRPQDLDQSYGFSNSPTQFGTQSPKSFSNSLATSSASSKSITPVSQTGFDQDYFKHLPHTYGNQGATAIPQSSSQPADSSAFDISASNVKPQDGSQASSFNYGAINNENQYGTLTPHVTNLQASSTSASTATGSQSGSIGIGQDNIKNLSKNSGNQGEIPLLQGMSYSQSQSSSTSGVPKSGPQDASQSYAFNNFPLYNVNQYGTPASSGNSNSQAMSTDVGATGSNDQDFTKNQPQYYGNPVGTVISQSTSQSQADSRVNNNVNSQYGGQFNGLNYSSDQFGTQVPQAVINSKVTSSASSTSASQSGYNAVGQDYTNSVASSSASSSSESQNGSNGGQDFNESLPQYNNNQGGTANPQDNQKHVVSRAPSVLYSKISPQDIGTLYDINNLPIYNENQFGTQVSQSDSSSQATSSAFSIVAGQGKLNGVGQDYTKDFTQFYDNQDGRAPQLSTGQSQADLKSVSASQVTSSSSYSNKAETLATSQDTASQSTSETKTTTSASSTTQNVLSPKDEYYDINIYLLNNGNQLGIPTLTDDGSMNTQTTTTASTISGHQSGVDGDYPYSIDNYPFNNHDATNNNVNTIPNIYDYTQDSGTNIGTSNIDKTNPNNVNWPKFNMPFENPHFADPIEFVDDIGGLPPLFPSTHPDTEDDDKPIHKIPVKGGPDRNKKSQGKKLPSTTLNNEDDSNEDTAKTISDLAIAASEPILLDISQNSLQLPLNKFPFNDEPNVHLGDEDEISSTQPQNSDSSRIVNAAMESESGSFEVDISTPISIGSPNNEPNPPNPIPRKDKKHIYKYPHKFGRDKPADNHDNTQITSSISEAQTLSSSRLTSNYQSSHRIAHHAFIPFKNPDSTVFSGDSLDDQIPESILSSMYPDYTETYNPDDLGHKIPLQGGPDKFKKPQESELPASNSNEQNRLGDKSHNAAADSLADGFQLIPNNNDSPYNTPKPANTVKTENDSHQQFRKTDSSSYHTLNDPNKPEPDSSEYSYYDDQTIPSYDHASIDQLKPSGVSVHGGPNKYKHPLTTNKPIPVVEDHSYDQHKSFNMPIHGGNKFKHPVLVHDGKTPIQPLDNAPTDLDRQFSIPIRGGPNKFKHPDPSDNDYHSMPLFEDSSDKKHKHILIRLHGVPNKFKHPVHDPIDDLPNDEHNLFNIPLRGGPNKFKHPVHGPIDDLPNDEHNLFNIPLHGGPNKFKHPVHDPIDDLPNDKHNLFNIPLHGGPNKFNHPVHDPIDDLPNDEHNLFNIPLHGGPNKFKHPVHDPIDDLPNDEHNLYNIPLHGGPNKFKHSLHDPIDALPNDEHNLFNIPLHGGPKKFKHPGHHSSHPRRPTDSFNTQSPLSTKTDKDINRDSTRDSSQSKPPFVDSPNDQESQTTNSPKDNDLKSSDKNVPYDWFPADYESPTGSTNLNQDDDSNNNTDEEKPVPSDFDSTNTQTKSSSYSETKTHTSSVAYSQTSIDGADIVKRYQDYTEQNDNASKDSNTIENSNEPGKSPSDNLLTEDSPTDGATQTPTTNDDNETSKIDPKPTQTTDEPNNDDDVLKKASQSDGPAANKPKSKLGNKRYNSLVKQWLSDRDNKKKAALSTTPSSKDSSNPDSAEAVLEKNESQASAVSTASSQTSSSSSSSSVVAKTSSSSSSTAVSKASSSSAISEVASTDLSEESLSSEQIDLTDNSTVFDYDYSTPLKILIKIIRNLEKLFLNLEDPCNNCGKLKT